jgi:hypothetical protein
MVSRVQWACGLTAQFFITVAFAPVCPPAGTDVNHREIGGNLRRGSVGRAASNAVCSDAVAPVMRDATMHLRCVFTVPHAAVTRRSLEIDLTSFLAHQSFLIRQLSREPGWHQSLGEIRASHAARP